MPALASPLWANAPNLLTYQGRLQESGVLVNGARSVELNVCNALTAGTCYPSGIQGVSVANGLFRSTFTMPGGVDLSLGPWYLQVSVGPNPGSMTVLNPREQLTSVAYALRAGTVSPGAIGTGVLSSGVSVPATQVFGGVLGSGVYLPSYAILPGALGSGVTLPAAQIGGGVIGSGVIFAGGLGSGATLSASQITSGVLGSGQSIVFVGNLGSGVMVPAAQIGAGVIGSGVVFAGGLGSGATIPASQITSGVLGSGQSIVFVGNLGSGVLVSPSQIGAGMLGTGVTLGPGVLGSGVVIPAAQVGGGVLGTGVVFGGTLGSGATLSASQITSGVLGSGQSIVFVGNLGSGVVLPASQIGAGTLGTGVVFAGGLGSGATIPAAQITSGVLGSGQSIVFVGNLGSGVVVPAAQIGGGMLGSGVILPSLQIAAGVLGTGVTLGPGVLGSGVIIPADQIGAGTLGTGVIFAGGLGSGATMPASQITPGVLGTGVIFAGGLGSGATIPAAQITSGVLGSGQSIVFVGNLGSGVVLPATQVGAGVLGTGVVFAGTLGSGATLPAAQITSGVLGSGQSIVFMGALGSGVTLPAAQISAGTLGTGVVFAGGLGSGATIPATQITSGVLGSGQSIVFVGTLGSGVTLPAAQVGVGTLGTGVHFADNVGIGTNSPGFKLDIVGPLRASGNASASRILGTPANPVLEIWASPSDTNKQYLFWVPNDNRLRLDRDNGLGEIISFWDSGDVTTPGKLGIGTTSPSTALEVVGTVTATSFVGNLGTGVIIPAAQIGSGSIGSSVMIPAAQITSGVLGSGQSITFVGTLGSGVFISPAQIGAGVIASNVIFGGTLGTGATIPASFITSGVLGSGQSITFVGELGSGVVIPPAQIAAGTIGSGVVFAGTMGAGAAIPAGNLVNGPVASFILPSTVAYTSAANEFTAPQVIASSLSMSGALSIGGVPGWSNGTLVVRSTSTNGTNPVLNLQNFATTRLMTVDQNGRVTIGTAPIGGLLNIAGGANPHLEMNSTDGTGYALHQSMSGNLKGSFGVNSGDTYVDSAGGNHLHVRADSPAGAGRLTLETGMTPRLTIMPSGDVGIGSGANTSTFSANGLIVAGTVTAAHFIGSLSSQTVAFEHVRKPPLRYTRTTMNYSATDAAKDGQCVTEFGASYAAAMLQEVAMVYTGALGTGTIGAGAVVGSTFNVRGDVAKSYQAPIIYSGTNGSGILTTSGVFAPLACISVFAMVRFTDGLTSVGTSDALKDSSCSTQFGSDYMAAQILDVIAIGGKTVSAPPGAPSLAAVDNSFNVAGNTIHSWVFRNTTNPNSPINIEAVNGSAYHLACIRK